MITASAASRSAPLVAFVGCTRTVYCTGDDLCPVEAYKNLRRLRGDNWHDRQPFVQDNDGWTMSRASMTAVLKACAIDCGIPAAEYATHSLRIGGATAMAATGKFTDDEVRRFGRWKSDCWRRYVHAARSACRAFSSFMSRVVVKTEGSAREYRATAPSR